MLVRHCRQIGMGSYPVLMRIILTGFLWRDFLPNAWQNSQYHNRATSGLSLKGISIFMFTFSVAPQRVGVRSSGVGLRLDEQRFTPLCQPHGFMWKPEFRLLSDMDLGAIALANCLFDLYELKPPSVFALMPGRFAGFVEGGAAAGERRIRSRKPETLVDFAYQFVR